jgi:putative ABC transport system permease protein
MTRAILLLRQAGRALIRRPLYASVAALTVAAGIAASTASFVLVDAALLSPLPFAEPDRLVAPDTIGTRGFEISLSMPNYYDWSKSPSFEKVGGSAGWSVVLGGHGLPRVLDVRQAIGDFLPALGFEARHGRLFGANESEKGAAPIVVLGWKLFQELGADPGIVEQSLLLDGTPYTVVGVLPPGVGYPNAETMAYLPLGVIADRVAWEDRESSFGLRLVGRLKPGVTVEAAQADLTGIAQQIAAAEGRPSAMPKVITLAQFLVGDLRSPLLLLFAAAALVVLLAIANVTNLFLARAESRREELAVRAALGAPRWDALRLQLAEAAWIALAGAALGLVLALGMVAVLRGWIASEVPSFVAERMALSPKAALFAFGVAGLTALALGLLPAFVLSRRRGAIPLQGTRAVSSRHAARFRTGLVIGQLALGTVLTIAATLFGVSLDRLRSVDKGFDHTGIVAGLISPPQEHFAERASYLAFHDKVLEEARRLPGVESASVSLLLPLAPRSWERSLLPEGVPFEPEKADSVLFNIVSPGHFDTFRIPLLDGRNFDARDRDGAELVTIVDDSLAARYWPNQNAIGRRVAFESQNNSNDPNDPPVYRTIVGVVKNVRHYELQNPSRIQVYIPIEQTRGSFGTSMALAVRSSGDPAPLVKDLPRVVAGVDPEVPMRRVLVHAAVVDGALVGPRLLARIAKALGILALVLAGVGVFAVASYGVAARRRELGLRQALGATPSQVLLTILRDALRWCTLGTLIGVVAAAVAARVAASLLWGVGSFELLPNLGAVVVLATLSLAAAALPAIQAMRIDPATILREET